MTTEGKSTPSCTVQNFVQYTYDVQCRLWVSTPRGVRLPRAAGGGVVVPHYRSAPSVHGWTEPRPSGSDRRVGCGSARRGCASRARRPGGRSSPHAGGPVRQAVHPGRAVCTSRSSVPAVPWGRRHSASSGYRVQAIRRAPPPPGSAGRAHRRPAGPARSPLAAGLAGDHYRSGAALIPARGGPARC